MLAKIPLTPASAQHLAGIGQAYFHKAAQPHMNTTHFLVVKFIIPRPNSIWIVV
jgi:hypothetical protein